MIWYVHRGPPVSEEVPGPIQSAHGAPIPGYAEEALDDQADPEIIAYRAAATAISGDGHRAPILRRAAELEASPDLASKYEGLKLRLSLVTGG